MRHASVGSCLPGVILTFLLALCSPPLRASTLEVQNVNANGGDFAARISVASDCKSDTHGIVSGTIEGGEYVGCSTLTSDADLASGATTFTAGDRVILREGFMVTGATLTVEIDRALYPDAWVQDDTPDGETVYAARFSVDMTNLGLDDASRFYHFLAFDAQGQPELRVGVKNAPGLSETRLFMEVFADDGGVYTTENINELAVFDGWHWVDVFWQASAGDDNGLAYVCIDAVTPPVGCVDLSNLDNDTGAIDFVRWGAVDVPSGEFGLIDFDDFVSTPFDDNFESGTTGAWSSTSGE
jgi:hypothetical protein